ncbi:hypothetical protein ABZ281_10275 [Streptomyces sp. NPDC006265]
MPRTARVVARAAATAASALCSSQATAGAASTWMAAIAAQTCCQV